MKILCIIPARYQSSRFPGKPLASIANHPMIEWVYKRAKLVKEFDNVLVATDDERIEKCVRSFGGEVELTPCDLASGTDRVAYVAKNSDADVVVNIQGDEPLVSHSLLSEICKPYSDDSVIMTTAIKKAKNTSELMKPGAAWVVVDKNLDALYFSRAILPVNFKLKKMEDWIEKTNYYKHIGIYTYRNTFLQKLTTFPKGSLERAEDLEQLRVLENGFRIRCVMTDYQSIGVDYPEDIKAVEQYINQNNIKLDE